MKRARKRSFFLALGLIAPAFAVLPSAPATAATVPTQFTDALVANVPAPTAVAFMPDGRMLLSTQPGQLRVRTAAGALLATPALNLSSRLCTNSERGLLGVAADPDAATRAIYLFYTARGSSTTCPTSQGANPAGAPVNRVSRFILGDNNIVDPASETVLLDGIYSPAGNHNAGDLHVGKDGYLYVSTGDGGCDYAGNSGCGGNNNAARDRNVLLGKILRVSRTTGAAAADNPFMGTGTASCRLGPAPAGTTCRETFAWGLRNPFRMAFDPDAASTVFRINDVGQNVWEEIDQGIRGADYGWNVREGHCANTGSATNCGPATPAGMTDPIYDYNRSFGCGSITGGAYIPNGFWPPSYDAGYLFADYNCGRIMMLNNGVRTDFATGLGGAVHLEFGPHNGSQALYYTTYANGGEVRRIAYTGTANRTPTAMVSASPSSGAAPLTTTLSGAGSSDPEGTSLTYLWSFGDGTADATTTTPTVSHTYPAGTWTATLRVRDAAGLVSAPATTTVRSGNQAPAVSITSPASGALFTVGTSYTLTASATDAEDGALAPSRLSWQIVRVHDQHTHPFLGPVTGNNIAFTAPGPEDLPAASNSYLRIRVTATDAGGATTTVERDFRPRTVALTVATNPAGRGVTVNGTPMTGPATFTSWAGFNLQLAVPAQTDALGRPLAFEGWSDGVATASRTWVSPSSAATLTANFRGSALVNRHNNLCLDDYNGVTTPGAEVRQWTCTGSALQQWYITPGATTGYVHVVNRHSRLCLDNYNWGTAPGTEVRQWTCNSAAVQDWQLRDAGSGYYTVVNRHSGLCLDNYNWGTTAGSIVRLYTCTNAVNQQWRLS